jgi:hypothetical protein
VKKASCPGGQHTAFTRPLSVCFARPVISRIASGYDARNHVRKPGVALMPAPAQAGFSAIN